MRTIPTFLHRGSLMTYRDEEIERCVGYLFNASEHGIFDPNFGKVDITADEAATHNRLLSQAEIHGLDQNCKIGMGGTFYLGREDSHFVVRTWIGQVVSRNVIVRGKVITFLRNSMTFRGRLKSDEDCFFFKRIE